MPSHIKPEDFDYHAMPFNASNVPDKRLHRLYATAWMRFYFNSIRIFRILKTKATWNDLPYYFYVLLKNLFTPKGNQRLVLEPVNFEFKKIHKKRIILLTISQQAEGNVIEFITNNGK